MLTSYRPDGLLTTRTVVWTDRAVYRPGETVAFAGVVRRFHGESLLVPEPGELRVEFGRSGGSWTTVRCRLDVHGTVHGTLPLPADTRLGDNPTPRLGP